jgi:DNA polymerase-4
MLAAMAAASSPPGQITGIGHDQADIDAFLRPQPIGALYGVGPKTAGTLARHGLHTIGAVADTPLLTLQRLLGATTGRDLHARAHGHDPCPVTPHSPSPSLSADRLFSQDELDPDRHHRALLSIAEQLGAQLREQRDVCQTLTLTVRYADRTSTTKTRTLPEATSHSAALARTAYDLHATLGLQRARVRAIALRAHGLSPAEDAHHQLTLDPADDTARQIEAAADRARARFGPAAVTPATLASAADGHHRPHATRRARELDGHFSTASEHRVGRHWPADQRRAQA